MNARIIPTTALLLLAGVSFVQAQTITIEPIDSVVERGTAGTTQRVKVRRTGDTSKSSSVQYSVGGSGSSPALSGDFAGGFPSGTVNFAGDVPPNSDPDCVNITPPAAASALGLTKLDFCDGFAVDSIARGSTADSRTIGGAKKWTNERSTLFGGGPHPSGDFSHNSTAGTVTLDISANKFQSAMQAHQVRNGTLNGYVINKKSRGFYFEARVKQDVFGPDQQIAIWTMDVCHWDGVPETCGKRTPAWHYIELDFLEYKSGQINPHHWQEVEGKPGSKDPDNSTHCAATTANSGLTKGVYQLRGVRGEASNGPAGRPTLRMFVNNKAETYRNDTNCKGAANNWFDHIMTGQHPLLIGGQVGDVITIDFVRVWTHPLDG